MRRFIVAFIVLLAAASATRAQSLLDEGKMLVELNCARCHATGLAGESAHEKAPAFRELIDRYPIDALEEAFASGHITSGHPDMPDFIATPEQAGAIVTYIDSLRGG